MKIVYLLVRGNVIRKHYYNSDSAYQFQKTHPGYRVEEVLYDL